jgi:hypothetical protein
LIQKANDKIMAKQTIHKIEYTLRWVHFPREGDDEFAPQEMWKLKCGEWTLAVIETINHDLDNWRCAFMRFNREADLISKMGGLAVDENTRWRRGKRCCQDNADTSLLDDVDGLEKFRERIERETRWALSQFDVSSVESREEVLAPIEIERLDTPRLLEYMRKHTIFNGIIASACKSIDVSWVNDRVIVFAEQRFSDEFDEADYTFDRFAEKYKDVEWIRYDR